MLENMEKLEDGRVRLNLAVSKQELYKVLQGQDTSGEDAMRAAVNRVVDAALEDALLQSGIGATAMRRPGPIVTGADGVLRCAVEVVPLPRVKLGAYNHLHLKGMRIQAPGRELTDTEQEQAENALREALTEQVVQQSRVELPSALVEARLNALERHFSSPAHRQQLEPAARSLTGQALREKLRPRAEALLKRELVLDAVADSEGLRVTQRDTDVMINHIAEQYNLTPLQVRQNIGSLELLRAEIRRSRAADLITARAIKE